MTRQELAAWLTLSFTPRLGGSRLLRLLEKTSPVNLLVASDKQLAGIGFNHEQIRYFRDQAPREVDESLAWRDQDALRHIVTPLCPGYPPLLKQIGSLPPLLFVQGNLPLLSEPQIAIVGSRNATIDGLRSANAFAAELAKKGLTITSGLALGVDGHAHNGALSAGGDTIAVLGCGLQHIYPARHRQLADNIVGQGGALVSEFRPSAKPRPQHFPRRNRIISGLSLGVLVVEAAEKSGSLITARYASEQGREVFALPGAIQNPAARGCNQLIKQGACLVQCCEDILQEIESLLTWSVNLQTDLFGAADEKEQLPFPELLANVGGEATPVDILAQRTHIPVHEIMMQLLELELQGHVAAVSGGYIRTRRG